MSLVKLLLFFFSTTAFALPSPWYHDASFILNCENKNNPAHLLPFSFFEFSDEVTLRTLPAGLTTNFTKIAPITFKTLDRGIKSIGLIPGEMPHAELSRVDPLVHPPEGCKIELMVIKEYSGRPNDYKVNKNLWSQVSTKLQGYFLLEAQVQRYLRDDLSAVDYRRFSLYVYSGVFENYSIDQKIFFLKHHGISEFSQSNVSLDLNRTYNIYENKGIFKDGFGFTEATFESGLIDKFRRVSFYPTGVVSHVATLTPFKRKIKGQEFEFFATKLYAPANDRYDYRTSFYPNGNVKSSEVVPFKNLYTIVTDIKNGMFTSKRDSFEISFHENQTPSYLNTSSGTMKVLGKPMTISSVSWWENGNPHEVFFLKRENVMFQDKYQEVGGLSFSREGIAQGRF